MLYDRGENWLGVGNWMASKLGGKLEKNVYYLNLLPVFMSKWFTKQYSSLHAHYITGMEKHFNICSLMFM